MAAAYNAFIQGINAVVAHAPTITPAKVQQLKSDLNIAGSYVDNIHHHHDTEESFFFPELEKKLGAGALSQHKEFVPQLIELTDFLEAVKSEARVYDGPLLVQMIHSF
ncbi:hypothetical protein B0H13DRAFT_1497889, partial [Mycena leptocephala]